MLPRPELFEIRAVRRLPPPLPTFKPRLRSVPLLPPTPRKINRQPEMEIELTEADFLEVEKVSYVPKTRVFFEKDYSLKLSDTGLIGIVHEDTPDWPICSLFIKEDDCLVGESDMDLPDGYTYFQTETREDGTKVLHFTHILKKASFFIPLRAVNSVRSLSANVVVWKNWL